MNEKDPGILNTLKNIPILSDEGSGVIKFATDYELLQFFCMRHLINKFGPSTELGCLVRGLLFSKTRDEFINKWNQKHEDIVEIFNRNNDHLNQFEDLFQCKLTDNGVTEPGFDIQSLWSRARYRCPSCTNHSESMHSHLNYDSNSCKLFYKRIKILLKYITSKFNNAYKRRNLKDFLNKIKNNADQNHSTCHCKENPFKKALYDLNEYPCKHNIQEYQYELLPKYTIPMSSIEIEQREVNEFEKETWKFPQKRILPQAPLTKDDELLLATLGFPEDERIYETASFIHKTDDLTDAAIMTYLKILFVHYSSLKYGYYNYSTEALNLFNDFAFKWMFNKVSFSDLDIEADRNSCIEELHKLNLKGDIDCEQEYFKDEDDKDDEDDNDDEDSSILEKMKKCEDKEELYNNEINTIEESEEEDNEEMDENFNEEEMDEDFNEEEMEDDNEGDINQIDNKDENDYDEEMKENDNEEEMKENDNEEEMKENENEGEINQIDNKDENDNEEEMKENENEGEIHQIDNKDENDNDEDIGENDFDFDTQFENANQEKIIQLANSISSIVRSLPTDKPFNNADDAAVLIKQLAQEFKRFKPQ